MRGRAWWGLTITFVGVAVFAAALTTNYVLLPQYERATSSQLHVISGSCASLSVFYGSNAIPVPSLTYRTLDVPPNSNVTILAELNPGCTLLSWDTAGGIGSAATRSNKISFIIENGESTVLVEAANLNFTATK